MFKSEHGIHLCARVLAHSSFHLYTPKAFFFGRNKCRRSAWGFIRYGHIMGHLHVAAKFAACDENSSHRSPDPRALLCSGRCCGCNSAHSSATRRPFAALKTAAAPPSYAGSSAAFPSRLPFLEGKFTQDFRFHGSNWTHGNQRDRKSLLRKSPRKGGTGDSHGLLSGGAASDGRR